MLKLIDYDVKEMQEKYGMEDNKHPCSKCGEIYPWEEVEFFEGSVCFIAEDHGCGKGYNVATIIPITEKEKKWWGEIL